MADASGEQDPWIAVGRVAELRTGSSGGRAIIAHPRREKAEASMEKPEACVFCPEGRSKVEPYFQGGLRGEMDARGLYVIGNKFPVVTPETGEDLALPRGLGMTVSRIPAAGIHLVMIEDPHDLDPFSDSAETRDYYGNLVWGYVQMLRALKAGGYEWGGIGKNRNGVNRNGSVARAGASQPHPHSQAIATDTLPDWLERCFYQWSRAPDEATDSEGNLSVAGCPGCMVSRARRYEPARIAADDRHISFVSTSPDVNPWHKQIRILPYSHSSRFDEMTDEGAASLSGVLHKTMMALNYGYPDCGYNFELRQGPWKPPAHYSEPPEMTGHSGWKLDTYHWDLRVYPAYSELGTMRYDGFMSHLMGMPVLTETPESFARSLGRQ